MQRWTIALTALSLVFVFAASPARANDQEFVVGAGLGGFNFSESDDFRQGSDEFNGSDEIDAGVLFQLYGEWYLLDDIGFGLRLMSVTGARTYENQFAKLEDTANVQATLITVNWIPLGSEDYVRLGLMGGLGGASYEAKRTFTDKEGILGGDSEDSESTSGTASLLGVYVDWGADGFGARFGVSQLYTDLDPIKSGGEELAVDGTGTAWYFDLRWAWE